MMRESLNDKLSGFLDIENNIQKCCKETRIQYPRI